MEPISPISSTVTLVGSIAVTTYTVTAAPEEKQSRFWWRSRLLKMGEVSLEGNLVVMRETFFCGLCLEQI